MVEVVSRRAAKEANNIKCYTVIAKCLLYPPRSSFSFFKRRGSCFEEDRCYNLLLYRCCCWCCRTTTITKQKESVAAFTIYHQIHAQHRSHPLHRTHKCVVCMPSHPLLWLTILNLQFRSICWCVLCINRKRIILASLKKGECLLFQNGNTGKWTGNFKSVLKKNVWRKEKDSTTCS